MERPVDVFDYDVLDKNGNKIGTVTGLWADEATGKMEFASVKTGWIFGRNHVVPVREGQVDAERRAIRLPYDEQAVKDAPAFPPDHDLSPQEEARIYEHYDLVRSTLPSPTGLPAGREAAPGAEREEVEIPLREEQMRVGKRVVESGGVRLRKVVRTEVVNQPVELRREHIEVERVPPGEVAKGPAAGRPFQEEEIVLHERREEPVVGKTTEVVGGVRAERVADTEREEVRGEVRREDVEIERE